MRRKNQLELGQPDLRIEALRGNVPTRIQKLRDGYYNAIMLAHAACTDWNTTSPTCTFTCWIPELRARTGPRRPRLANAKGDPLLPFVAALTDPDTVHAIGFNGASLANWKAAVSPAWRLRAGGTRNVYTHLGEARGH